MDPISAISLMEFIQFLEMQTLAIEAVCTEEPRSEHQDDPASQMANGTQQQEGAVCLDMVPSALSNGREESILAPEEHNESWALVLYTERPTTSDDSSSTLNVSSSASSHSSELSIVRVVPIEQEDNHVSEMTNGTQQQEDAVGFNMVPSALSNNTEESTLAPEECNDSWALVLYTERPTTSDDSASTLSHSSELSIIAVAPIEQEDNHVSEINNGTQQQEDAVCLHTVPSALSNDTEKSTLAPEERNDSWALLLYTGRPATSDDSSSTLNVSSSASSHSSESSIITVVPIVQEDNLVSEMIDEEQQQDGAAQNLITENASSRRTANYGTSAEVPPRNSFREPSPLLERIKKKKLELTSRQTQPMSRGTTSQGAIPKVLHKPSCSGEARPDTQRGCNEASSSFLPSIRRDQNQVSNRDILMRTPHQPVPAPLRPRRYPVVPESHDYLVLPPQWRNATTSSQRHFEESNVSVKVSLSTSGTVEMTFNVPHRSESFQRNVSPQRHIEYPLGRPIIPRITDQKKPTIPRPRSGRTDNRCYNCLKFGHYVRNCKAPLSPVPFCMNCGKRPYTLKDCPTCALWYADCGGSFNANTRDPWYDEKKEHKFPRQ